MCRDQVRFETECETLAEGWLEKKTSSRPHRYQRRYFFLRQRSFSNPAAANPWLTRSLAYHKIRPDREDNPPQSVINIPQTVRAQIYDGCKFSVVDEAEGTKLVMQLKCGEERHAQLWLAAFAAEWTGQ